MFSTREPEEVEGTFVINHGAIIQWFQSISKDRQDEWIQEVTGIDSAVVIEIAMEYDIDDKARLEVTFEYL